MLLDVGADAEDAYVVGVEEIVAQVELGEPQGDDEFCVGGGEVAGAEEGESEIGPCLVACQCVRFDG